MDSSHGIENARLVLLKARRRTGAARLEALLEAEDAVRQSLRAAVHEARREGLSWADIGRVFEISRQAAHERFRDTSDLVPQTGEPATSPKRRSRGGIRRGRRRGRASRLPSD